MTLPQRLGLLPLVETVNAARANPTFQFYCVKLCAQIEKVNFAETITASHRAS
jgi:hypothetical protein